MMKEMDGLVIRDFQHSDLRQVADIFAEAFRDDFLKIVSLPQDKMADFLIGTGEVFPYPFDGYVVAKTYGEIVGVMMLKWRTQKRPKTKFRLSQSLRYGWLPTIKLLFERFLFSEKPLRYACHVEGLAVRSDVRDKGIGIRLLNFGKVKASKLGLKHYTLHVDVDNKRALNLYRKLGFNIVKKHRYLLAGWLIGAGELYFMN